VVVFRGTEIRRRRDEPGFHIHNIIADFKTDADIVLTDWDQDKLVYRGFKNALEEVWEKKGLIEYIKSKDTMNRTIWFTGHSLGAALATFAADRYDGKIQGLYTLGSPYVGNIDFVKYFRISAHRFVNNNDIVAHWPPLNWYEHVGEPKFIDGNGIVYHNLPHGQVSDVANSIGQARHGFGHLIPDFIVDHVPVLYATHIWNNIP